MKQDAITTANPEAEEAIRRWDELKGDRAQHESDWEDIARLIRPQRGNFASADPARKRNDKPLSSAPIVAQSNFASGLYGSLVNPANRWMGLKVGDPELARFKPMQQWQDEVTTRVLASFRPAVSPFYSAMIQIFGDLSAFGNGAQYDEIRTGERKIMDVTLSLASVVYDIDAFGQVNEVVRRFELKARAAAELFGVRNLPSKLQDMAEKGTQEKVVFFHHVKRNTDWVRGRLGPGGRRWLSLYACEMEKSLVRRAGYDEMPFHAPRWEVETGATYGTGPGFTALASARANHQMEAANLRAGQKAADPTILAPDKQAWALSGTVAPGRVVYGGVNMQGQRVMHALDNFGSTGLSLEMQERKVEEIRDAFHWSLMNLAGRTGMTATEIIERQEEKMRLMAPHMGRVQEELLAPKIVRRFSLLWRAGQLPPPPVEAEGVPLEVEYTSAAAMAQKSAEGAAVVRILEDIAPLAAIDPRYIDRISPDDTIEVLQEARGAPSRVLRSREAADKIAEGRAQQTQMAQAMEAAQAAGGVAKDAAQAGAMLQGQGGGR